MNFFSEDLNLSSDSAPAMYFGSLSTPKMYNKK